MCSSLLQLTVESRDLSQDEKKKLFFRAEKIPKMTTIFIQNGQSRHFEWSIREVFSL